MMEPPLPVPPIGSAPRGEPLPVSFAQERLWFLDQSFPARAASQVVEAFRLRGILDLASLGLAFGQVVARHEILRSTFPEVDGHPVQVISPQPASIRLCLVDLARHCDPEAAAAHRGAEEAKRPFDLATGPLLRALVMRLSAEEHIFVMTMHHMVADGVSLGIFVCEIGALYGARLSGEPSPLSDLPIQYADFAFWQREGVRDGCYPGPLDYWTTRLRGCPSVLDLPTDRPRPSVRGQRGATVPVLLPPSLAASLRRLSHENGATLFSTLLAAFQVLLSRYSGREDIVVGAPVAGRYRPETKGIIGYFVNGLVLRTDLSGNPSFLELLARVGEVVLGAHAHQEIPFELLVEGLQPARNLSNTPFFQQMFVLDSAPTHELALRGIAVSQFAVDHVTANFDLTLELREVDGTLNGFIVYDIDLFDRPTVERMVRHFEALLEGIVTDPLRPVMQLEMLSETECHQLLVEWNDTDVAFPSGRCIHELVEDQVARTPDALAVVYEGESLTYRELDERANRLGQYLRSRGVGPEVLVGICVERSLEMVVGLLGILKAGGAYVPLDPSYPPTRLAFMLEDSNAAVLLTQSRLLGFLPSHRASTICIDADWPAVARQPDHAPIALGGPRNLAYVIYTSGSTGQPKGVMIEHRGVVNLITWHQREYRVIPADRSAQIASLAFDVSVWEIWPYLAAGARVLIPNETVRSDGDLLSRWLAAEAATIAFLPTAMVHDLFETPWPPALALRALLTGGDILRHGPRTSLPFLVVNNYGPTETTVVVTSGVVPPGKIAPHIGRPIANTEVYILDAHLRPVPVGVTGELHIGGPGLARGYLNRPEMTAERFIAHPFSADPAARLYRSGDLARYLRDGNIGFVGRLDDQVKVRGFRVEPAEVEAVLTSHPSVSQAAVVARVGAGGERRLLAYVVGTDRVPTTTELRSHLRRVLPEYMVPAIFVVLDALPITPNGKVDRAALPAPGGPPEVGAPHVAPHSPAEQLLAGIWSDVLGLDRVGVKDDFFELGGDSLMATQMVAQAERIFSRRLPLALIMQAGTIEAVAKVLDQQDPGTLWRTVFPMKPGGSRPPVFCLHGLDGTVTGYRLIIPYLGDNQPVYGVQCVGLDGERVPYGRVEDMAAHYIDDVKVVQPHGPYVLVGICFGSLVAIEMAHQLTRMRSDVALVALIDPAPMPVRTPAEQLTRRFKKFRRLSAGDRLPFLRESLSIAAEMAEMRVWDSVVRGRMRRGRPVPRRTSAMEAVNRRATRRYIPPVYKGRVVIYRSEGLRAHPEENRALAWDTLAGANVEVVDVAGTGHNALFAEPNIGSVAAHLKDSIDRAVDAGTKG